MLFVWVKKVVPKPFSSTKQPETEQGPRPIEACLGGHDDGDQNIDEGSKRTKSR